MPMPPFPCPKTAALLALLPLSSAGAPAASERAGTTANPTGLEPSQVCEDGACTLSYEPAFFSRYAPVTALDMLENLPGFQLEDGDSGTRGFGGAAGNVVLNGARISAKSESPSDVLARIPASEVERIDVIRGQVGGLDLRGQNVVANVIRRGGSASGAWSLGVATYEPGGRQYPSASLSYSTSSRWGEATFGLDASESRFVTRRRETVSDSASTRTEDRFERFDSEEQALGSSLNASTRFAGWAMNANLGVSRVKSEGGELSLRFPLRPAAEPFELFQGDFERTRSNEIGVDAQRALGANWQLKLIGLYRDDDSRFRGSLVRGPREVEGVTETATSTESVAEELIGRLELDYSGIEGHTLELSAELTRNTLDSAFTLRTLEDGELVERPVPGAVTEVEEERIDVLLSDSFRLRNVSMDAALGIEDSTIRQVGGFEEERTFLFWKPSLTMSFSPSPRTQWRLRAVRNVGQLDLQDFASGADLGDVELSLGNPQLSPEATTTFDLSFEIRGAGIGIGALTLFHDRIEDVNDLLPLTGQLEVPGNIGTGQRTGVEGNFTLPLDRLGLKGGRVDWRGRWQDSDVDDPLTGEERPLSGERRWTTRLEFRQDLPARKFAWGAQAFARPRSPQFGLDELDEAGQRWDMDVFMESRAFRGLVVSLRLEDVFRDGEDRDRRVFAGDRSSEPLAFRERREQSRSITATLEVRGTL